MQGAHARPAQMQYLLFRATLQELRIVLGRSVRRLQDGCQHVLIVISDLLKVHQLLWASTWAVIAVPSKVKLKVIGLQPRLAGQAEGDL